MATTSATTRDQADKGRMRRLAILGGPSTRPISGRRWFPLYGIVHHLGRKSGRAFDTPVVIRQGPDGVYVPLPFGERTDWYRNSLAAGRVRVTWKGQALWLTNPTILESSSARPAFNRLMRGLMAIAGIAQVVRFDLAE